MIVYNITIKVDWSIAEEWLTWMKAVHMPEIMTTECFESNKLFKLLEVDETEGPTYAAQYFAASMAHYEQYLEAFAPAMRQKTMDKWGAKFIAFRSLMEVVE